MVYDESGKCITNIIHVGECSINMCMLDEYILESVKDEDIDELKQLIKDSSNESANKIKNLDSRFKFLKEKTKSILRKVQLICTGGGIGGLIGSAANFSKNKNTPGSILFVVSLALLGTLTAIDSIINKNDQKKDTYKNELNNLASEVIDDLQKALKNKNISSEEREKIEVNIMKISKLSGKSLDSDKEFFINGDWLVDNRISKIDLSNNEDLISKAVDKFDMEYDSTIAKVEKEVEKHYKNKKQWDIGYYDSSINADDGPKLTFDRKNNTVTLTTEFMADVDNKDISIHIVITMTYNKSGKFSYSWEENDIIVD